MLSRGSVLSVLACSAAILMPSVSAHAEGKPPVVTVTGDAVNGAIDTTVTSPGTSSSTSNAGSKSSSNDGGVTCTWKAESDYSQQVFQWMGADPNGSWYDVTCSDGRRYAGVYVPPSAGNIPPAVVLAGSLAKTAANSLRLPGPAARHNPAGHALVGLATWWWVDPTAWKPLRQRTQAGPVWAEVTATPVSTTWDAGDGSTPVVCAGPGTPYDTSMPASEQSTDCSYTYRRSSAGQPQTGPSVNDRFFTVTVTTTWQVSWTGTAGSGGTLPQLTTSRSFPLAVAQRQTVVTGGSG